MLVVVFHDAPRREEFHVNITPSRQTVRYGTPEGPAWEFPQGDPT